MTVKVPKAVSDTHFQSIVDDYLDNGWTVKGIKDSGKEFELELLKK